MASIQFYLDCEADQDLDGPVTVNFSSWSYYAGGYSIIQQGVPTEYPPALDPSGAPDMISAVAVGDFSEPGMYAWNLFYGNPMTDRNYVNYEGGFTVNGDGSISGGTVVDGSGGGGDSSGSSGSSGSGSSGSSGSSGGSSGGSGSGSSGGSSGSSGSGSGSGSSSGSSSGTSGGSGSSGGSSGSSQGGGGGCNYEVDLTVIAPSSCVQEIDLSWHEVATGTLPNGSGCPTDTSWRVFRRVGSAAFGNVALVSHTFYIDTDGTLPFGVAVDYYVQGIQTGAISGIGSATIVCVSASSEGSSSGGSSSGSSDCGCGEWMAASQGRVLWREVGGAGTNWTGHECCCGEAGGDV